MNSQTLVPVSSFRNSIKVTRPEVPKSKDTKNKSLLKNSIKVLFSLTFINFISKCLFLNERTKIEMICFESLNLLPFLKHIDRFKFKFLTSSDPNKNKNKMID